MDQFNMSEIYEAVERLRREKQDGRAELARFALITHEHDHEGTSGSPSVPVNAAVRWVLQVGAGVIALLALWFG